MSGRWQRALLVAAGAVALVSSVASASVKKEGSWPEQDKAVTLDLEDVPRAQAVRKLAEAAGWSVVYNAPTTDKVDVRVKDQPADKVLELLLSDAAYVADRDGPRIAITRVDPARTEASAPPAPPSPPPPPPTPGERGRDRVVSGGSLRIDKGETVRDVAVFGGSADVWGNVTGDLVVYGGSVHIHPGAHVHGDASAVGGSLTLEDGARVDGDVETLGGSFQRGEGSVLGGSVKDGKHRGIRLPIGDGDQADRAEPLSRVRGLARDVSDAVASAALLFVFGTVFIALGGARMEQLTTEIAARPMRSFALGVVGLVSSIVLLIALCVIVVGIPFALIGVLLGAIALVAGLIAALTTVGTALVRHKTESPYVHLAVGCLLWLLVGAIPFVGPLAKLAVVLIGIGSLVATRAAGLVPPRKGHPYRTMQTV